MWLVGEDQTQNRAEGRRCDCDGRIKRQSVLERSHRQILVALSYSSCGTRTNVPYLSIYGIILLVYI